MFRLVERCLDGDNGAWVELWEVFEDASAAEVRQILAEHGVTPEDADAVVTKCWGELTGSGSTLGEQSDIDGGASPPKIVPVAREPASSCGRILSTRLREAG